MNTLEIVFTTACFWITSTFLLVVLWKKLIGKNKIKNPIHFNKPDND